MVYFEAMLCGDMCYIYMCVDMYHDIKIVMKIVMIIMSSSVFSRVFAITEISELGLYDVPMFMSLFVFGIGIASFHV